MVDTSHLALHPWNTGFSWTDCHGPFRALSADQAAQFNRDGYVVLEDVFAAEELRPVVAELDRCEARVDAFLQTQEDGRFSIAESGAITIAPMLTAHSPLLAQFIRHPTLMDLCSDLIGPDVNLYWDQAVYKKTEKPRRVPWHQDNGYKYLEPQAYLTCWIALTDATIANGCPQVASGMHRLGTLRHTYVEPLGWECFADPPRSVPAPVRAGGIVVFSSLTPHLTGPNTTPSVRKAYIVQFAPAGATALLGDPDVEKETERVVQNDPSYQFAVLRDGRCV